MILTQNHETGVPPGDLGMKDLSARLGFLSVQHFRNKLLQYARRLNPHDLEAAEDAVHTVILNLLERSEDLEPIREFEYCLTAVTNAILMERRRDLAQILRMKKISVEEIPDYYDGKQQIPFNEQKREWIECQIHTIGASIRHEKIREAFLLWLKHVPMEEIAKLQGAKLTTVLTRCYRGRCYVLTKLRRVLSEHDEESFFLPERKQHARFYRRSSRKSVYVSKKSLV